MQTIWGEMGWGDTSFIASENVTTINENVGIHFTLVQLRQCSPQTWDAASGHK